MEIYLDIVANERSASGRQSAAYRLFVDHQTSSSKTSISPVSCCKRMCCC